MSEDRLLPSISVPNAIAYTPVLTDFVRSIGKTWKLDGMSINKLCLAVEEAFINAVSHGFPSDEKSLITLRMEFKANNVSASLHYLGYPLDPALLPGGPSQPSDDGLPSGLGLLFMHEMMDQVEFLNHGSKGQETRLTMHIGVKLEAPTSVIAEMRQDVPPHSDIVYSVRRIREEEAVEVARMAYISYGDTYPYEDIYYPERVRELNRLMDLVSFVAVTDDGEIISHAALAINEISHPGMAELGLAFTKPKSRGLGCFNRLVGNLVDQARGMGLYGTYIMAVTSHPYTQKCAHKFGFVDCALLAAGTPALRFNKISDTQERESILLEYTLFQSSRSQPLYAPLNHKDIIRTLCARLGVDPVFAMPHDLSEPTGPGRLNVATKPIFGSAQFTITEFGTDTFDAIHFSSLSLLINGNAPLTVRIPLNSPHAPGLIGNLETVPGWFFGGIIPDKNSGFDLLMQHTGRYELDYSRLASSSDHTTELLAYIQSCDQRGRRKNK